MTKQAFVKWRPNKTTKVLLDQVLTVIWQYTQQGYSMTLRQLYYQLVKANIVKNDKRVYQKLSRILTNARESGILDWNAIVDRNREYSIHSEFQGLSELVEAAMRSFRLPRWEGQKYYVEVVTEKDALSGVLQPVCDEYHVGLLVDRGYGSTTVIYDMAERFKTAAREDKKCVCIYLGDHDPSGLNMPEDIQNRLTRYGAKFELVRIGLTYEQVQHYQLPPNPVKEKDSRAGKYIARYGRKSWELDALPPDVLVKLLEEAILQYLDLDLYKSMVKKEAADLVKLENFRREAGGSE